MIVPASTLPTSGSPLGGANDNGPGPSQSQLLMAAAEMHKLGRLSNQSPRFRAPPKPKLKPL